MTDEARTAHDPAQPLNLTRGELARLRDKAIDRDYWFKNELDGLTYGQKRIAERVVELEQGRTAISVVKVRVENALAEADKLPRGRRVLLQPPWELPEYNRHRRLAVMERSFI